jgi:hypothetical protein
MLAHRQPQDNSYGQPNTVTAVPRHIHLAFDNNNDDDDDNDNDNNDLKILAVEMVGMQ